MRIEQIFSFRKFDHRVFYDIVYQWEDIIASTLGINVVCPKSDKPLHGKMLTITKNMRSLIFRKKTLVFHMNAFCEDNFYNHPNVIPYIIDFWVDEESIVEFESAYSNNPVVLISSKEVYDYLKDHGTKIKIAYCPLSIPDGNVKESFSTPKDIDICVVGRTNPVLKKWVHQYVETHPDTIFVSRKDENGKCRFVDTKGNCVIESNSRESYNLLLQRSKCTLYSTPGTDGDRPETNGFSPVTPRFLEFLSNGCHVLTRYSENSDTKYYEFDKYWKSMQTYEMFEEELDRLRATPIDEDFYQEYLSKHKTSYIANIITDVMNSI